MASDGDVARLRWHYATFNAGDVEAAVQNLAVDIRVRTEPGLSLVGGDVHGHGEMRTFLSDLLETIPGLQVEPLDFLELGNRVMIPVRLSGRTPASAVQGSQELVHTWTLRDGLPAQLHVYLDAEQARADFEANRPPAWASPGPGEASV